MQLVGTVKPGEVPMTTFTAMWRNAWIPVHFKVDGELYCTELVDIDDPVLKYPKAPEPPEGKVFVGWDRVEGDYLMLDSTTSAYEVNAYVADASEGTFTVTFNLRNDRSIITRVPQNGVMPQFHIKDDDGAWKFRYWELTSGTMTSSRTILSDCVFAGVYDEIVDSAESEMLESADGQSSLSDLDRQLDSSGSQLGC